MGESESAREGEDFPEEGAPARAIFAAWRRSWPGDMGQVGPEGGRLFQREDAAHAQKWG